MDADLTLFTFQVFKFKGECVEAASFIRTYKFIVAVILFTGKIENPLSCRGGSVPNLKGAPCALCVRQKHKAGVFFSLIGKTDPVLIQMYRLVFDFNIPGILRNRKVEISYSGTACREGRRQFFFASVESLCGKAVRITVKGKH